MMEEIGYEVIFALPFWAAQILWTEVEAIQ